MIIPVSEIAVSASPLKLNSLPLSTGTTSGATGSSRSMPYASTSQSPLKPNLKRSRWECQHRLDRMMWYWFVLIVAQASSSSFVSAWAAALSMPEHSLLRPQSRADALSMFLSSELAPRKAIEVLLGGTGCSTRASSASGTVGTSVSPKTPPRDGAARRVLGFDVFALEATPSNVNMEAWKRGSRETSWSTPPKSGLGTHPYAYFPFAEAITTDFPPSLPWMPTRSHIDSLKVVELKQACHDRGLPISGTKAILRDRLWNWTVEQQERQQIKITGDFLTRYFEETLETTAIETEKKTHSEPTTAPDSSTPDSLADWARNRNFDLLRRRKEIHRQMREGRPVPSKMGPKEQILDEKQATPDYLKSLARALRAPSSPYSSNIQVKELYAAIKQADQLGERKVAFDLLQTLLMVTPSDARVYRRLARMYSEDGDIEEGKEMLRAGLEAQPENPWLWHGLGQLERAHGTYSKAKECFQQAIECDAKFAQSYHALGTMEHAEGRIASAMRIIKRGLEFCPTNHRLWHAYGDVYRAAQMLEDAERSYKRALEHGPTVSRCFAFSALAAVSYEQGDVDKARGWLSQALKINSGRHAQGWVALAQLEEAEGNVEKARLVCSHALAKYERGLVEARHRYLKKGQNPSNMWPQDFSSSTNSTNRKDQLMHAVPKYRSGDKFVHVYQNWARLEERFGSPESVDAVYARASAAFPRNYQLLLRWAQYHAKMMHHERARAIFQEACQVAGKRHADPYREAAELEMTLSNYKEARKILYLGARAVTQWRNATHGDTKGLSHLLSTWAICEWHLGDLDRTEELFDHALRLAGETGSPLRAFILYSIARMKHYRGELHAAQHCVGLALKEKLMPGGNGKLWLLWAAIAEEMGNAKLKKDCLEQAATSSKTSNFQEVHDVYRLLKVRSGSDRSSNGVNTNAHFLKTNAHFLKRDPWKVPTPWKVRLFENHAESLNAFKNVKFPRKELLK